MAKIAIFLCLLVASVYSASVPITDADDFLNFSSDVQEIALLSEIDEIFPDTIGIVSSLKEKLRQYKEKMINFAKNAVEQIRVKVSQMRERVAQFADNVAKKGVELKNKAVQQIDSALKKIDDKVDELIGEVQGVDVSECTEVAKEVHEAADKIVDEIHDCVGDSVEVANGHIERVTVASKGLFRRVQAVKDKAVICTQEVEGFLQSIGCIAGAMKDAYYLIYSDAPAVIREVKEAGQFVKGVVPSMAKCTATKSVGSFKETIQNIVPNVRECIDRKVREAGAAA